MLCIGCSTTNIIGDFKYQTKVNRVNSGEFNALIFKYKQYHLNGAKKFSNLIKAQKLGFESEKDTIFAYGKMSVKYDNANVLISVKQININGYDKFTKIDSIERVYKQLNNGDIELKKYISYWEGRVTNMYDY